MSVGFAREADTFAQERGPPQFSFSSQSQLHPPSPLYLQVQSAYYLRPHS